MEMLSEMLRDPFFRCDSDYHRDKFARCERLARCNNACHKVWPRHGNPSTKWLEFYITKSQFLVITPFSSHLLSICAFHFYPKQDTFWLLQWSSCISHSIPHFSSSFAHLDCWAISNWCRWFWGKTCEPTFISKHQQMIGGKHRRGVIANFGKQNLPGVFDVQKLFLWRSFVGRSDWHIKGALRKPFWTKGMQERFVQIGHHASAPYQNYKLEHVFFWDMNDLGPPE